jgi:putative MATE family efflux protein
MDQRGATDMTKGNIWRLVIVFSIPLMFGNLLQELYNAFDAMVVGNFVGKEALAAVGISLPMISTIVGFFMGISSGASVWVARSFGAKDQQALYHAIHTAMALSVMAGVVLSLVGMASTPTLLHLMMVPEDIFPEALIYFRIYFFGLTALTIYNMGTAILNAMGDSKKPLLFLAISAMLNVLLDLLFVVGFHMGIAGVAWATVIAEGVSAVLVVLALTFSNLPCRLSVRKIHLHRPLLKGMFALGAPVGFQHVIIGISNLLMLMYINRLGTIVVAGWSVVAKLNAFIYPASQAIALAVITFVGQNLGARQVERARKGVKISVILGLLVTISISLVLLAFNTVFLRVFSPEAQVIASAQRFMYVLTTTYFMYSLTQIIPGALISSGRVRIPMLMNITAYVIIRQLYLLVISALHYTPVSIALAFPVSWVIAGAALLIYYKKSDWSIFES